MIAAPSLQGSFRENFRAYGHHVQRLLNPGCDKAALRSGNLLTQIVSYRTSDVEASNFPDLHPGRETSKS